MSNTTSNEDTVRELMPDEAFVHILPSELEQMERREMSTEVASVAFTNVDSHERSVPLYTEAQVQAAIRTALAQHAGAGVSEAVPEGCTPKDAQVLREANHVLAAENHMLREALQFYADREHFNLSDPDEWDTVSGEPTNFWCDGAGTATVEDGTVAAMALKGTPLKAEPEEVRALGALGGAGGVPAGWKLVPVKLTQEMEDAVEKAAMRHRVDDRRRGGNDPELSFHAAYEAALAAASGEPK